MDDRLKGQNFGNLAELVLTHMFNDTFHPSIHAHTPNTQGGGYLALLYPFDDSVDADTRLETSNQLWASAKHGIVEGGKNLVQHYLINHHSPVYTFDQSALQMRKKLLRSMDPTFNFPDEGAIDSRKKLHAILDYTYSTGTYHISGSAKNDAVAIMARVDSPGKGRTGLNLDVDEKYRRIQPKPVTDSTGGVLSYSEIAQTSMANHLVSSQATVDRPLSSFLRSSEVGPPLMQLGLGIQYKNVSGKYPDYSRVELVKEPDQPAGRSAKRRRVDELTKPMIAERIEDQIALTQAAVVHLHQYYKQPISDSVRPGSSLETYRDNVVLGGQHLAHFVQPYGSTDSNYFRFDTPTSADGGDDIKSHIGAIVNHSIFPVTSQDHRVALLAVHVASHILGGGRLLGECTSILKDIRNLVPTPTINQNLEFANADMDAPAVLVYQNRIVDIMQCHMRAMIDQVYPPNDDAKRESRVGPVVELFTAIALDRLVKLVLQEHIEVVVHPSNPSKDLDALATKPFLLTRDRVHLTQCTYSRYQERDRKLDAYTHGAVECGVVPIDISDITAIRRLDRLEELCWHPLGALMGATPRRATIQATAADRPISQASFNACLRLESVLRKLRASPNIELVGQIGQPPVKFKGLPTNKLENRAHIYEYNANLLKRLAWSSTLNIGINALADDGGDSAVYYTDAATGYLPELGIQITSGISSVWNSVISAMLTEHVIRYTDFSIRGRDRYSKQNDAFKYVEHKRATMFQNSKAIVPKLVQEQIELDGVAQSLNLSGPEVFVVYYANDKAPLSKTSKQKGPSAGIADIFSVTAMLKTSEYICSTPSINQQSTVGNELTMGRLFNHKNGKLWHRRVPYTVVSTVIDSADRGSGVAQNLVGRINTNRLVPNFIGWNEGNKAIDDIMLKELKARQGSSVDEEAVARTEQSIHRLEKRIAGYVDSPPPGSYVCSLVHDPIYLSQTLKKVSAK